MPSSKKAIAVRLDDEEYEAIRKRAETLHISMSKIIRMIVFDIANMPAVPSSLPSLDEQKRITAKCEKSNRELMREVSSLRSDLNRIGNNLNQLTRGMNEFNIKFAHMSIELLDMKSDILDIPKETVEMTPEELMEIVNIRMKSNPLRRETAYKKLDEIYSEMKDCNKSIESIAEDFKLLDEEVAKRELMAYELKREGDLYG